MSADGVKAGKAYVELTTKDQLDNGLARAREKLAAWARGLTIAGTAIQAAGLAGLATIGALAHSFATRGSEIHDLSQATGVSAEHLSALGYAAKQSGVELSDLSAGMRGLAKFTGKVSSGSKEARGTLEQLGIASSTFLAAKPDQRLALIADGLRRIGDPGLRAALAMKALGKSGSALLPMLNEGSRGLNAFLTHAARLGLVISTEDAKKADALGDAWDDLLAVLSMIGFRVGAAVAETLTGILQAITPLLSGVAEFIKQNQTLVLVLAGVAVGAAVAGGALVTLGGILAVTSLAMGAVAGIGTALATAFAFVTSPIGIFALAIAGVVVAIAAAGYAFLRFTSIGQAITAGFTFMFSQLWKTASTTFAGIYAAIAAGRLDLAATVAAVGIYAAFTRLWTWLKQGWSTLKAFTIGLFADLFAQITRQLQAFHAAFFQIVNLLRSQLGLAPLEGLKSVDAMLAKLEAMAKRVKQAANKQADAEVAAAEAQSDAADAALAAAVAAVRRAKAELDAKNEAEAGKLTDLGVMPSITSPGGSSLGTFSAAVAGLLGRSGVDHAAERTAKATEEMADDLSAIRRHVEDGGLEFG